MHQSVFRFAPSPNGHLHLGHALSALLNHEMARASGGRFLLRIEDIDPERCRPAFELAIFEDLAWLGLDWEEPVRRQSEHIGFYAEALDGLKQRGLVYPCFCSRGDIRAAVQECEAQGTPWPRDPDGAPLYPGSCRNMGASERARRLAQGDPHVWRLDMFAARVEAPDVLEWRELGGNEEDFLPLAFHPQNPPRARAVTASPEAWGDVVMARRDVPTSYHLSVVLDDAVQGITHVVRGRDLFHATSVHRLLQCLLGLPEPSYRHHRLVLDETGRKLSKSDQSTSLRALRAEGATPDDIRRMLDL